MEKHAISTVSPAGQNKTPVAEYAGPTYHGRPSVKSSPYGWLVWSYIHVAGIAGGAQIIATIANLFGRPEFRSLVRNGRFLAVGGSAIGSVLLIADLHTPQRWYNMLRIFRRTSPMSIGSYILTSFGVSSAITAAAHLFRDRQPAWMRKTESVAQIPAAAAGAGMGCYTAALLSATSTPLWGAAPRLLAARFASSAMASAAAALSLFEQLRGRRDTGKVLDRIACTATVADAGLTLAASRQYQRQGLAATLQDRHLYATQYRLARGIAQGWPLLCYGLGRALPRHSRTFSVAAALGVLAGGLLMRSVILNAGNASAQRPQDYFAFTGGTALAGLPAPADQEEAWRRDDSAAR